MPGRLQQRRDTAGGWTSVNPVLKSGEVGWELADGEAPKHKVGDGVTPWNDLEYGGSGEAASVDHDHDGSPTQQLLAANTHGSPSPDTHHDKSHEHSASDGSGQYLVPTEIFVSDILDTGGLLMLGGTVSTSAEGTQNNFNPSGWPFGFRLRSTSASFLSLTGLVAGNDSQVVAVEAAVSTVILQHENTGSSASNRFNLPYDSAYNIFAGERVLLYYNGSISRWELLQPLPQEAYFDYLVANDFEALGSVVVSGDAFFQGETYFEGGANIWGNLALFSFENPPQITSNQNDYAPTGFDTNVNFRLTSDAARDITGMGTGNQSMGWYRVLANVGSFPITLKDQSASSSAFNRFALGSDVVLAPNSVLSLWYDATTDRWRPTGLLYRDDDMSQVVAMNIFGG